MKKTICHSLMYLPILLLLLFLFACTQVADGGKESAAAETSEKSMDMAQNQGDMSKKITGTVAEKIDAGRYVYVRVDTGKEMVWAAAPAFDGKVGDKVVIPPGIPMAGFHSKTLNRDFKMIYFVGAVLKEGESVPGMSSQALPKNHPAIDSQTLPKNHPSIDSTAKNQMMHPGMSQPSDIEIGTIQKAKDGQTVAQIITNSKTLAGKLIKVRAKVVKFTPNIMEKNWVHVRDGSGEKGTNDLIVTTTDQAKVGDVVLITGVVSVDRDFGFGLVYPVIVEKAKIAMEQ